MSRASQRRKHILRQPQFPFDSFEVEESLEDVLAHFSVNDFLFTELTEIRCCLLPRGESPAK